MKQSIVQKYLLTVNMTRISLSSFMCLHARFACLLVCLFRELSLQKFITIFLFRIFSHIILVIYFFFLRHSTRAPLNNKKKRFVFGITNLLLLFFTPSETFQKITIDYFLKSLSTISYMYACMCMRVSDIFHFSFCFF